MLPTNFQLIVDYKGFVGRGERIRTSDPLVPNQVLYQAEPLPEHVLQMRIERAMPGGSGPSMRLDKCSRKCGAGPVRGRPSNPAAVASQRAGFDKR